MPQVDAITLRENAGWEPTMRLKFYQVEGKRVLHQLWNHVSGRSEWRAVPLDEDTPPINPAHPGG